MYSLHELENIYKFTDILLDTKMSIKHRFLNLDKAVFAYLYYYTYLLSSKIQA